MTRITRLLMAVLLAAFVRLSTPDAAAQEMSLPAGTSVAIKTIDPIESQGGATFLEYRATIDDPVLVGTKTIVPGGSPAFLRVVEVKQSGAVTGQTSITIVLAAVVVNGERFALSTSSLSIASASQTMKVAKGGLVGALIGGAIGAAVGGKAGMAQGAALGGAAGAAASMGAQKVSVKSEARLSFTLASATRFEHGDAPDEAIRKELIAFDEEIGRRVAAADRSWLEEHLDPAWELVFNGARGPRAAVLQALKPIEMLSATNIGEPDLRTEGERYILSGTGSFQYREGRKVQTRYQRWSDVFVRKNGGWMCVLSEIASTKK